MRRSWTLIAVVAVSGLVAGAGGAAPTDFGKVFCGGFDFGTSGQAGNSPIYKISNATSEGDAYSDMCDGSEDGSYTWKLQHGKINVDTDRGNEHGTFTYLNGPEQLGGIFNGKVIVYDPVTCVEEADDAQDNVVYQSAGRFNTLRRNANRTGSDSSFHAHGTYTVTVTADETSGDAACFFEAHLAGLQN